ncbi:hypothetical protein [Flavobacterium psychrotrophum]|uniref:hypothetical protein n=1 Tax=Flavobacterium psychrotrophum TaxID=2294119 RepID=UPI000E30D516|nr:hypothetical protein [Flavobacterium psychrotrophum]
MSENVIDKILWIEGFYPFSLKYDLEKAIKKHKQELENLNVDSTSMSIFKFSNYFNVYFKNICETLEYVLSKSTLSKSTFIDLIISDLNRTETIISEDTNRKLFSGDSYDNNSLANLYIQKPEFQNDSEPVWGLIDSAIETATLNLNYLNYVKFIENDEPTDEISHVDVIRNIGIVGSSFNAIKQAYDRIIWKGYVIEENESGIKLKSNQYHLMLDNIALTRLMRNVSNTQNELQYYPQIHKTIIKIFHATRHFQAIKLIEENDGEMILKYQARSKKPTDSFISFIAPILTYYPFFHSEKISAFENLTILDLVNLFSILCDFVMVLPMPGYDDTEVKDLAKFKRFNPKVKKSTLISYFRTTTNYSEKEITVFLNLLIQKEKKYNLFLYSVYEEEDYYFFSHSTIKRANMLYLVDKWLEAGNCDLAERGHKFEDYIKNFLRTEKLNEFAKFKIIEQSRFSFLDDTNTRFEEEIDLVLKTETSIIVAEIKCTTYPLDPDDFYSSFQTLKKAKRQVARKSKFLEDNWEKFEHILGQKGERKIEQIIIVNFPHYAGRNIDEIPIADFYLFLSYFKSGKFVNLKIERSKGITRNEILYYDSVHSFEGNFEHFFRNPVPIEDLMVRQKIEEYEVTLNGTVPKTISERVIYIEKTPDKD